LQVSSNPWAVDLASIDECLEVRVVDDDALFLEGQRA
jgi:hypothetical protein